MEGNLLQLKLKNNCRKMEERKIHLLNLAKKLRKVINRKISPLRNQLFKNLKQISKEYKIKQ